jgi:cytochrome P450
MYRFAEQAITLSTGVVIPKCSKLVVSNDWAVDPHHFENPEKLDPYRFMSLMQGNASEENKWKYVSTSAEHMGFGHGRHSCPGRFFASTLIKIALVTVLMKYDVRFVPDQGYAKRLEFETFISQSPKGLIQIKKCKMDDKILARLGLE